MVQRSWTLPSKQKQTILLRQAEIRASIYACCNLGTRRWGAREPCSFLSSAKPRSVLIAGNQPAFRLHASDRWRDWPHESYSVPTVPLVHYCLARPTQPNSPHSSGQASTAFVDLKTVADRSHARFRTWLPRSTTSSATWSSLCPSQLPGWQQWQAAASVRSKQYGPISATSTPLKLLQTGVGDAV